MKKRKEQTAFYDRFQPLAGPGNYIFYSCVLSHSSTCHFPSVCNGGNQSKELNENYAMKITIKKRFLSTEFKSILELYFSKGRHPELSGGEVIGRIYQEPKNCPILVDDLSV